MPSASATSLLELHEVVLHFALAMRLELGKVGQLLPVSEIELELQASQAGQTRTHFADNHCALHDGRMAGESADVGIHARLFRRGEGEFIALVGIDQLRVHPEARVLGNPVAFERFLGLVHLLVGGGDDVGPRREKAEIVRHLVVVFENELHLLANLHLEFRGVVAHLRAQGFDGDGPGLTGGRGARIGGLEGARSDEEEKSG